MLKDLKEKAETMYEDMGNFRKLMESIKNGNSKKYIVLEVKY